MNEVPNNNRRRTITIVVVIVALLLCCCCLFLLSGYFIWGDPLVNLIQGTSLLLGSGGMV